MIIHSAEEMLVMATDNLALDDMQVGQILTLLSKFPLFFETFTYLRESEHTLCKVIKVSIV